MAPKPCERTDGFNWTDCSFLNLILGACCLAQRSSRSSKGGLQTHTRKPYSQRRDSDCLALGCFHKLPNSSRKKHGVGVARFLRLTDRLVFRVWNPGAYVLPTGIMPSK